MVGVFVLAYVWGLTPHYYCSSSRTKSCWELDTAVGLCPFLYELQFWVGSFFFLETLTASLLASGRSCVIEFAGGNSHIWILQGSFNIVAICMHILTVVQSQGISPMNKPGCPGAPLLNSVYLLSSLLTWFFLYAKTKENHICPI